MDEIDEMEINELLKMQEHFMSGKEKPAASCIRPKSKLKATNSGKANKCVTFSEPQISTYETHLEHRDDESHEIVDEPIGSICERFVGFFEMPDRVTIPSFPVACEDVDLDADDLLVGDLPDVPDLSEYWFNQDAVTVSGKSVFSMYFDRIQENKCEKKKMSKFKASRQKSNIIEEKTVVQEQKSNDVEEKRNWEEEVIKNLEVFKNNDMTKEDAEKYSRLAMDAVNINLASKLIKNTMPRQEATVLRLFDMLKRPPTDRSTKSNDCRKNELCDQARTHLEEIKALYLEQFLVEQDLNVWRFAADVNPVASGEWSLIPLRRVLDAVQQRGLASPTNDDVEICRLSLLWSVLLLVERPFIFHQLSMPADVYVRLAELYLIGPKVFEDNVVSDCISLFISNYLFEKGRVNLLKLRLHQPVAMLDAFLPFYEDLLKHYEEYSSGNANYALIMLIAAYMNSALGDGLILAQAIWVPGRYTTRQICIPLECAAPILDKIKERRSSEIAEIEEQHHEAYARLLAMYTVAIRDESVTRTRNPVVFEIASSELSEFVRRHTRREKESVKALTEDCMKEFDVLVDVIRQSTAGKVTL